MQGTVILVHPDGKYGYIRPDGGGHGQVYVHVSSFREQPAVLQVDSRLEFETVEQLDHKWPAAVDVQRIEDTTGGSLAHIAVPERATVGASPQQSKNCFVVMPIGRTDEEKEHFFGWYQVAIEPAILEVGLYPILSAVTEQPNSINDEIRSHLAMDPMVVVDLGGFTREAEPNANVMYELGIRHAFNLPHVIMAWDNQRLPFDIANQRVLMEGRRLKDVVNTKRKLASFIRESLSGNYYRPMDAVGRFATLSRAESQLGEGSILRALVQEVRELKSPPPTRQHIERTAMQMKSFIGDKVLRREVHAAFMAAGGTSAQWAQLLCHHVIIRDVQGLRKKDVIVRAALASFGLNLQPHLNSLADGSTESISETVSRDSKILIEQDSADSRPSGGAA